MDAALALIPLFPLLGFLVNASFGRGLSKAVSGGLASAAMVASFAISVMAVWQLAGMPVESFIQTGQRTALSYLVKPFSDQISRVFLED